jgi:putative FmdB family regulatory protein
MEYTIILEWFSRGKIEMPIYTYECEDCGVRFDARQKFSDDPITVCPECGGHTHRVPQAVGIVFKGSGWYATDSKGTNHLAVPPKKEKDGNEGASEPAKSDAKSENAKNEKKSDSAASTAKAD